MRLRPFLVTLAFALTAAGVAAQNPAPRVSLDCTDASFPVALRTLLRGTGARSTAKGSAPDVSLTLRLQSVPLDDALDVLVRQASFSSPGLNLVRGSDGVYHVDDGRGLRDADGKLPPPPELSLAAALERPLPSVHLSGDALRRQVCAWSTATGLSCVVDPDVPDVPLTGQPERDAWSVLEHLVSEARKDVRDLYLGRIGEIYVLARHHPLPGDVPIVSQSDNRRVSVRLERVPLRAAVRAVLDGTGLQYAFEPSVPDIPITIHLRNVSITTALRWIVREASRQLEDTGYSVTVSTS